MALNYDFDMLSTVKAITDADASKPGPDAPVALFRDPATVEALERAPQVVQDYLRASHFGINCYHSGAPAGRYPEADDAARIVVIEALAWNVARFALPHANDRQPDADEFHLPAFFAAVAEAEPIAMSAAPMAEPDPAPAEQAPAAFAAGTEAEPISMDATPMAEPDPVPAEQAPAVDAEPAMMDATRAVEPDLSATLLPEPELQADATPAALPISCLILTEQHRVVVEADTVTDSLIAGMFTEDAGAEADHATGSPVIGMIAEDPAPEADLATDSLIADMIGESSSPDADLATDSMIAEMMSTETPVAEAAEALPVMPPPRFRLPSLPRWMTAGAAFTILGVAFGSALI